MNRRRYEELETEPTRRPRSPVTRAQHLMSALVVLVFGCATRPLGDAEGTDAPSGAVVACSPSVGASRPRLLGVSLATACAVRSGQVYCWGDNAYGQLGTGVDDFDLHLRPTPVRGVGSVEQLAVGDWGICARTAGCGVSCWGWLPGYWRRYPAPTAPVLLPSPPAVSQVATNGYWACAIVDRGAVQCWGLNTVGQIGDGTHIDRPTPVPVPGLSDVVQLAIGGLHSCALRATGRVVCWGANSGGQIGDGSQWAERPSPVEVVGLSDAAFLAAGGVHTCAVRANGKVACWGANDNGACGDGTSVQYRLTPVAVVGLDDAVEVTAALYHTCARRASGKVVCWGDYSAGQLGNGQIPGDRRAPRHHTMPVPVTGIADAVELEAGGMQSCARRANGSIACWGRNSRGALGDGTLELRAVPVSVVDLPPE